MFQKIKQLITQHRRAAAIIGLIVAVSGYVAYGKIKASQVTTKYVLVQAQKGTLIVSVSASGQASVSNQVDIKSKASGDIQAVDVINGQEVKAGTLLVQVDTHDAAKAVRDAQVNLESAKLALQKLIKPADDLSLLQAQNSLSQAIESKQTASDDLKKAYDDGFNTTANAFLDLPTVMNGLHDILFGTTLSNSQTNMDYYTDTVKIYDDKVVQYHDDALNAYQTARVAYDKSFADYKATNRMSDKNVVEALSSETYDTTKDIAEAVKSANNLIQFYEDKLTAQSLKVASLADTHIASLNTYTGKTNTHLSNLLSIARTIQSDKDAIINADRSIAEKTDSLAKLQAGPDTLDIQSQQLSLKQKENSLLDAQEKLNDCYIRAPFDGIIAKLDVKKGDQLSSGAVAATIITKQRTAEITLNEVDVAKIKLKQKANLTFDAIPNLGITGEVAEIDTIGTVSQGVVSYVVKITFDTQDERVKPGMSISTSITTDARPDVLLVPNVAVKSQGTTSYVEMPLANDVDQTTATNLTGAVLAHSPQRQVVEVGASNDDSTEITSGLKEGDYVVQRTITGVAAAVAPAAQSNSLRIPGLPGSNGGGGGNFRRGGGG